MHGGVKTLIATASLAAAGCGTSASDIQLRPIADPVAKLHPGSGLLADARGLLALGNSGLALEAYRKALRQQPDSIEAYSGIAACYDSMGRHDLARRNYEAALALAPRDPVLLNTFALALERWGNRAEAAEVRSELAQQAAASAALDDANDEPARPVVAAPAVVTAILPPPSPVIARPVLGSVPVSLQAQSPAGALQDLRGMGPSITVKLPPARPVEAAPAVRPRPLELARADVDVPAGPRLERLSMGEVALITIDQPIWQPKVVARTALSTTVRWVPLRNASSRPNVQLLNAARRQGLAARTRDYLLDRGWRKIEIGDAAAVRESSVVLYPASRRRTGISLAAQFGIESRMVAQGDVLVVLLGRDVRSGRG